MHIVGISFTVNFKYPYKIFNIFNIFNKYPFAFYQATVKVLQEGIVFALTDARIYYLYWMKKRNSSVQLDFIHMVLMGSWKVSGDNDLYMDTDSWAEHPKGFIIIIIIIS